MTLEYEPILDETTLETYLQIISQTFHATRRHWDHWLGFVGRDNLRLIRKDGQIAGGLGFYRLGQWFGGKIVPMAGIAAVGILPEYRTAGIAAQLMHENLRELAAENIPLATLYATTQTLYRKVGYEQAGNHYRHSIPLSAIGQHKQRLPLRRVDLDDFSALQPLARARGRITNGNIDNSPGYWKRLTTFQDKDIYAYLLGDPAEGYVIFYQEHVASSQRINLIVRDVVATSQAAAESLWDFFRSHRSVADNVCWSGPAIDPLLLLPSELPFQITAPQRWMLRICDLQQALLKRGYPATMNAELHLDIHDPIITKNQGKFILHIAAGQPTVTSGGRGDLSADIQGFAPLYSSFLPPATLQAMGCVQGTDAALETSRHIFSGPEPWMALGF